MISLGFRLHLHSLPLKGVQSCLLGGMLFIFSGDLRAQRATDPAAREDEEMARQKLLKASDSIEDMRQQFEQIKLELENARKDLAEIRAQQQQLNKQDEKLADAIIKVDQARTNDRKEILDEIRKAAQSAGAASSSPSTASAPSKSETTVTSESGSHEKGYEHVVEKGHTLSAIAKAYGITVAEIKKANNLKTDKLNVGQKLFIPLKK